MNQSKLIKSLQALSLKEFKELKAYLFANRSSHHPDLSRFLKVLEECLRSEASIDKQMVFVRLYGTSVHFQEKKIRVLSSFLFQAVKSFLAGKELTGQVFLEDLLALAQLRKRRVEEVFSKQHKQIKRQIEQSPLRDSDYFFTSYELAREANGFYGQQHLRKLDDSLQEKMNALDAWYLSQKLKESCEMLNRQNVFSIAFRNPMLEDILVFLQKGEHSFWDVPSVRIYYQIYLCLSQGTEEHYLELVNLLGELFPFFQHEEARGLYKHAQNFCIRRINQGESEYLGKLFQLYQKQLENEVIFDRGELAHTDYKNIVTVGLRLREYDWVKDFIYELKERVQSSYRENVFNFSLASYYFETGQAKQAIRLLQGVSFTDVYYQISARQLLLRIYYDTDELESALYQIDAFGVFLRRNREISSKNRTQQINFLRWLKHLIRLKDRQYMLSEEAFQIRWKKLNANIHASTQTSNLEWLKLKISELGEKEYGI